MADDKTRPDADDRPVSALAEPMAQHAQPSQEDTEARPAQRASAGRKPLFRR